MTLLTIGLSLFLLFHLIPCIPSLRMRLVAALGNTVYYLAFNLISVLSVVLIVFGYRAAPHMVFYEPFAWANTLVTLLMIPAIYCFMSNSAREAPSSMQAFTAHTLSWGVVLWALGHLLANGDVASVLLFSSFLIYAVISISTGNFRGLYPARKKRPPVLQELGFIVIVLLIFSGLVWGHVWISGVALI